MNVPVFANHILTDFCVAIMLTQHSKITISLDWLKWS